MLLLASVVANLSLRASLFLATAQFGLALVSRPRPTCGSKLVLLASFCFSQDAAPGRYGEKVLTLELIPCENIPRPPNRLLFYRLLFHRPSVLTLILSAAVGLVLCVCKLNLHALKCPCLWLFLSLSVAIASLLLCVCRLNLHALKPSVSAPSLV